MVSTRPDYDPREFPPVAVTVDIVALALERGFVGQGRRRPLYGGPAYPADSEPAPPIPSIRYFLSQVDRRWFPNWPASNPSKDSLSSGRESRGLKDGRSVEGNMEPTNHGRSGLRRLSDPPGCNHQHRSKSAGRPSRQNRVTKQAMTRKPPTKMVMKPTPQRSIMPMKLNICLANRSHNPHTRIGSGDGMDTYSRRHFSCACRRLISPAIPPGGASIQ